MKEYRIVCTLEKENFDDGIKCHYDTSVCVFDGHGQSYKTHDLAAAKRALTTYKRRCAGFDASTRCNPTRDTIIYTQSNIRIQSREVTEWEDE